MIPHRDPFLLVDTISAIDFDQRALEGKRRISPEDPVFAGHFPGWPIYPGVLLLEMVGQLGLCLMGLEAGAGRRWKAGCRKYTKCASIQDSFIYCPVLPGDKVTLRALFVEDSGVTFTFAGQVSRRATICALGIMEVHRG